MKSLQRLRPARPSARGAAHPETRPHDRTRAVPGPALQEDRRSLANQLNANRSLIAASPRGDTLQRQAGVVSGRGAAGAVVQLLRIRQPGPFGAVDVSLNRLGDIELEQLVGDPAGMRRMGYEFEDRDLPDLQREASEILASRGRRPARRFQMINRADSPTPMNSLMAATEPDYHAMSGSGPHYGGALDERESVFSPASSNAHPRRDFAVPFAEAVGHDERRLPADALARQQAPELTDDPIHFEYLHQQAHSLGGSETVENGGIGSAAANTEMIPIEAGVAGRADLQVRVVFAMRAGTYLIEWIQMEVFHQPTGTLLLSRTINGHQRVFTREQYEALQSEVRLTLSPEVIAVIRDHPTLTSAEAIAVLGLESLSGDRS